MRILLVDDEASSRESVAQFLDELGHQVSQCSNGREALSLFSASPFPMVLSDIYMPKMNGLELLKKLKALPQRENTDIVILTGHGDVKTAIEALRSGAYEYLQKPVNVGELASIVDRIAEHQTLLSENRALTKHFDLKVEEVTQEMNQELIHLRRAYAESVGLGNIHIFSQAMKRVVELAHKFHSDRSISVLIEGETGTGKELVARLIHYGAGNVSGPLVEINCSAISPELFENELFGHEPAAFTGADKKGSKGKLEVACGGTLFLDEIGDMPLTMQPKLLRVLQEKEFYRVGGTKKIKADIRVVCATNHDLLGMVEKGLFRQDLYYRLNVAQVNIPPLRERKEAIAPLALCFQEECSTRKQSRLTKLSAEAITLLEAHSWPGNVRELKNVIERVMLFNDDPTIGPESFFFLKRKGSVSAASSDPLLLESGRFCLPEDGFDIEAINAEIIQKALRMHQGNKTRTAVYLGITRHVLLSKLRKI